MLGESCDDQQSLTAQVEMEAGSIGLITSKKNKDDDHWKMPTK